MFLMLFVNASWSGSGLSLQFIVHFSLPLCLCLSLSLSLTHTHTHTQFFLQRINRHPPIMPVSFFVCLCKYYFSCQKCPFLFPFLCPISTCYDSSHISDSLWKFSSHCLLGSINKYEGTVATEKCRKASFLEGGVGKGWKEKTSRKDFFTPKEIFLFLPSVSISFLSWMW